MSRQWLPKSMRIAPALDASIRPKAIDSRYALLINPFYPKDPHASFGKHALTPTLALTSIAAATPPEWSVSYWDENLLQGHPPHEPFPAVVGITVHLTFAHRAFELSRWYRERGAKVILGGLHVLACPDECKSHADALALGEGVQLWGSILTDVAKGALRRRYVGSYRPSCSGEPAPRRDLLPRDHFLTTASVIATRGCHNRCDFCYLSTDALHMPYAQKSIDGIITEITDEGQPYAVFTDNNLGSRPEYLRALCHALRPLNMIWSAAITIDVTDDARLIREMALAGCTGVFIGFESLRSENIVDARKRSPKPNDYARRVSLLHDCGIQVNGSFVLGFDHDPPEVFHQTVDWIESSRLECATFHIMTPYPSTPLFNRLEREGRILHRNWSLYDTAHAVFQPRLMSPDALEDGYAWCYDQLFSHRSIWNRRPRGFGAVPSYLAMSCLYKRSNWLWYFLIRHRMVAKVWRPLVEANRRRHLRFRRGLELCEAPCAGVPSTIVSAGV